MTSDDLTADERKALDAMRKDIVPSEILEERTVAALKRDGILEPGTRRRIELTPGRLVAAFAACIALVAVGFAFGQLSVERPFGRAGTELPGSAQAAAAVQQSGSAYITALDRLAAIGEPADSVAIAQGREVALHSLYAAADQTMRLFPDNGMATRLADALRFYDGTQPGDEGREKKSQVIWF